MGTAGADCLEDVCGCEVNMGGHGDPPSGADTASAAAQNQANI